MSMMEYSDYTSLILMVIIPTGILLLKIFIFWEILGILIRVNNILKKWRTIYDRLY